MRFIDPRIDINDPTENFAYSKFGRRRRTNVGFDAGVQIAGRMPDVEDMPEREWTVEDEVRLREQEEADAALEGENI